MITDFADYPTSLNQLLDSLGSEEIFSRQAKIVIKPNLVGPFEPPITTDIRLVAALIEYIRQVSSAQIILAEGSGECETGECFAELGYNELPKRYDIELMDLDSQPVVALADENALLYKKIFLPEPIMAGFLISVPVLKDHTLTKVSLGIKNLIGILPASKYGGYWSYRKSEVHRYDCDKAVVDISLYRPIDMVITDAVVGQKGSHLAGGAICDPPLGKLIASFNPLEADIEGAELLGHNWQDVRHLALYARQFKSCGASLEP